MAKTAEQQNKKKTIWKKIEGVAFWSKLNEKNRDYYDAKDKYGSYVMDLHVSEALAADYEKKGVATKRDKNTGEPFLRLKRPHAVDYPDAETKEIKTFELGPPAVVDETLEPFTGLIGNGSPVFVQVEERPYGRGKMGLRLQGVQVDTRTMKKFGSSTKFEKLSDEAKVDMDEPLGDIDV